MFSLAEPLPPLLQPTLLLYPFYLSSLSSLASFSYLSHFVNNLVIIFLLCPYHLLSLTLVSVYLFTILRRSCLSIVRYHICQTAIPFSFSVVQYTTTCASWVYSTDTYLWSQIQFVPAPFLSIHSSIPHLPDSDPIFLLHSPVYYHMCKLGLFQVIPVRIRTCELSHHSLAYYQLSKLDSDSYSCKIRVFIL